MCGASASHSKERGRNLALEAEVLTVHRRIRESFRPERLRRHLEERGVRIGLHRIRRLRRKPG